MVLLLYLSVTSCAVTVVREPGGGAGPGMGAGPGEGSLNGSYLHEDSKFGLALI